MVSVLFEATRYDLRDGESVLERLIRGGANVPFSCRKGSCHVCLMQCEEGNPGAGAVKGLGPDAIAQGFFLPCCAVPTSDVRVVRPDLTRLTVRLVLAERRWLSSSICELTFEPEVNISWLPGQHLTLRNEAGLARSYSITSHPTWDYLLTVHVKRIAGGAMSTWLCDALEVGGVVLAQGPQGACTWDPSLRERDLLLLGTGSGLAPLLGVVRHALREGHRGRVVLFHGSRDEDGLYLRDALAELCRAHPNLSVTSALTGSGARPAGVVQGRVTDLAFEAHDDLRGWVVYLAGVPDMVHDARARAILAGASREHLHADPFDYAHHVVPDEQARRAAIAPDPELWAALEEGALLVKLLTAFYERAFRDPRLAPFFHGVTQQRAIGQQYAFLADLIAGGARFFGLNPLNAHHWMIISDELFDYREALMETVMREFGLAEPVMRRWSALHERFRRDIVKASARGMVIDGVERPVKGPETVEVTEASLCDGCEREIVVGEQARYHPRGGKLFCARCEGVREAR